MQAYRNSREHIFDELRRLDLLIGLLLEREKAERAKLSRNEFRGLVIGEEEIAAILSKYPYETVANEVRGAAQAESAEVQFLLSEVRRIEDEIAFRSTLALEQGVRLSLYEISNRCGLTPFDINALLVCLAPELELKYERLYAYLQNDVTCKRPTIDLVFHLFCETADQRVQARARFTNEAPLFRQQIVCFASDDNVSYSFLSRPLKIDERVVKYLLDLDLMDEVITPFCRVISPRGVLNNLFLSTDAGVKLVNVFRVISQSHEQDNNTGPRGIVLHGPVGVGRKYAAEALCSMEGIDLLVANLGHLMASGRPVSMLVARLFREARLREAAIYLDQADVLMAEQESAQQAKWLLLQAMGTFHGVVFWGSMNPWKTSTPQEAQYLVNIPLHWPDFDARRKLWRELTRSLSNAGKTLEGETEAIASKFQFTPGKIHQAFAEARHNAAMQQPLSREVSADDLYRACRSQSTTNLTSLAQKVNGLYTWDDIVLPKDTLRHLKEICLHVKHRQQVFVAWNFNQKISLGKGISALFAGPPGTGKTMAAEIIANDLGLDLFKIDLSTVVSKYIGETEKNLNRIFQEAEQSNAILFFDEADALFGKRSEVKDAHDRYANIEINYLLQKMEEYEGIVIMASNFQKNIDEAFTRRLRFIVEIPFPDRHYRTQIWRNIFPAEMPRDQNIEFDFLAGNFEISGGHIKNIALSAAFLAAENSGVVSMKHVVRAAKREFQKMGRLYVKSDFGEYYELLEND